MDENKRLSTKVVTIPAKVKDFFRLYLEFIKPAHKMRPQEIKLLSAFMYKNYLELDNFKFDKDRWKKVFDVEVKHQIQDELSIGPNVFQNTMYSLRKKGALVKKDGYTKIANAYMPSIDTTTEAFTLSLNFKIKDE